MPAESRIVIGIVGPCGAGKSTLARRLKDLGYYARHIAQEHSYVPKMWKRIVNPDVLIYLDASYPVCTLRRALNWTESEYAEQLQRLRDARACADLFIQTDHLTPEEILKLVLNFLSRFDP